MFRSFELKLRVLIISPMPDTRHRMRVGPGSPGSLARAQCRGAKRRPAVQHAGRGGQLAGALLRSGLVDRYYWIQAPLWLGEEAVPALSGLPARGLDQAERWRVIERRALGEDTLLVLDRG